MQLQSEFMGSGIRFKVDFLTSGVSTTNVVYLKILGYNWLSAYAPFFSFLFLEKFNPT